MLVMPRHQIVALGWKGGHLSEA